MNVQAGEDPGDLSQTDKLRYAFLKSRLQPLDKVLQIKLQYESLTMKFTLFSVFVNTFMSTRYGQHWRERGIKIRPADCMWMGFGIFFGVMAFVFGLLYALVNKVFSFSFGEDGIFREISYVYHRLTSRHL